ncbi:MAG: TlpA family protein disulfide reductase [Bacteroidales bacterium]|nr:TlpA family protein disulfide reductase [Bacteroidales bacterium]
MKEFVIIARLKKYWSKRSWFGKVTDLLFYLFIILLIIPGSRKTVATAVNRIAIQRPQILKKEILGKLESSDFSWKLVSPDGKLIEFEEFRGKVVFLNFWATWCPPCRAEMPDIQRLYEDYEDRIAFILVTQEDPVNVQSFIEDKGYSVPFYRPASTPPPTLQSSALPTTYIINQQGEIVIKKTGAFRWDSKKANAFLDDLLK